MIAALALVVLAPVTAGEIVTKEDLLKLAAIRASDDAVILILKAKGPVAPLSADDLLELRRAGLSDRSMVAIVTSIVPPESRGLDWIRTNGTPVEAVTPPVYEPAYSYGYVLPSRPLYRVHPGHREVIRSRWGPRVR